MRPSLLAAAPAAPYTPDTPASAATTPSSQNGAPCTNCGATGGEHYCPRCGQETHDLHRSAAGILGELLDTFAGWDGKIPQTLWRLVRRPGGLTAEFLAGRRARYLRPLRLYLMMSVLFFVSLTLVPSPAAVTTSALASPVRVSQVADPDLPADRGLVPRDASVDAFIARHRDERGTGPGAWFRRHFVGGMARLQALPPAEQRRVLKSAFFERAPNMVFVLLPVFALLLRALYRRAPLFYAEHLVFSLHNHAFAFLALTIAHVASVWLRPVGLGPLAAVPLLWMPAYFFVSLRRVYGGSRRRTAAKFVALSGAYFSLLVAAVCVTALVSLITLS